MAEITSKVPSSHWRYVATASNPADVLSRGVKPSELIRDELWWKDPPWLSLSPAHWPRKMDLDGSDSLPDLKPAVPMTERVWPLVLYLLKTLQGHSWILRFVNRVKEKNQTQHPTYMTVLELTAAKTLLLRTSQHRSYHDVVSTLRKGKVLPSNHQLSTLAPTLIPKES